MPAMSAIKHGLGIPKMALTEVVFLPKQLVGFSVVHLFLDMLREHANIQSKYPKL